MGLFSSIGKLFYDDPSKDIRRGEEANLAQQQKALDYQMRLDKPLVDYRNQALGGLSSYFMGGQEGQQQFWDQAMSSPAYQNYLQQGEESILRNAAATGGVRGGAVNPALAVNAYNVGQGLVDRNLQGLQGFANPSLNTQGIANTYGYMGGIQNQSALAQAQAQQDLAGKGMDLVVNTAKYFIPTPTPTPTPAG